jgi:hypothetical protein
MERDMHRDRNRARPPNWYADVVPPGRIYTLVFGGLLLAVLVAGIVSGNPLAYIIVGVLAVFVGVPAVALALAARAEGRRARAAQDGHAAGAEPPPATDDGDAAARDARDPDGDGRG